MGDIGLETVAMLQKQIAGYCLMPTDPEVLEAALAGMHRAVDRLNVRIWNWALLYDDIAFVADQTDYELSNAFKAPRNFGLNDTNGTAVTRLEYKPWKTLLLENPDFSSQDPCVYSCVNPREFGTVSIPSAPASWVATYPTGRIWYYHRIAYPTVESALGVPSEVTQFIQSFAEGYTADRYAPTKAAPAYQRAREQLQDMIVDDRHNQQTDWE